ATPELGARGGVRGEGPGWVDASRTFPGYGIAPLQPVRRDVTLALAQDTLTETNGGWIPVRARLLDGGAPVANREVTFDLEWRSESPLGDAWFPHHFRAHGVTDADGWATAHLDADEFRDYWSGDPSWLTLRIAARYHGDPARRPASDARPITFSG
ncbi:MAG TPA: hypothetical protein VM638_06115, partial [Actinomycetota bacterium]|nr:hypothetical protein [Actinomycetota bacterium]